MKRARNVIRTVADLRRPTRRAIGFLMLGVADALENGAQRVLPK